LERPDDAVQLGVDFDLVLGNEVAITLVGAEEAVGRVRDARPDDGPFNSFITRPAGALGPTYERTAIKSAVNSSTPSVACDGFGQLLSRSAPKALNRHRRGFR
jgi:hypothetical protein